MGTKAYYPVCLDIEGRTCVVVGGGEVAERKVLSLLECQAKVRLVSPELTSTLQTLAGKGTIEYRPGAFEPGSLEGAWLVIGATDDARVNAAVSEEGQRLGLLVNVVDSPELCNFLVPAVVRRGPLVIGVSTGGASPLLARKLRQELEQLYGPEYATILPVLAGVRQRLKKEIRDAKVRQAVMKRLLAEGIVDLIREGREDQVEELVRACISSPLA